MPAFVPPMALQPVEKLPEGEDWVYELKWDGYRCQVLKCGNNVRLFSRNGNDFTDRFPEVADAALALRCHSALIDGEMVALDTEGKPCFQRLQDGDRDDCHICYYGFDLLHLDGRDLRTVPLYERKAMLEQVLRGTKLRFSASLQGSPRMLISEITKRKLEGIVAKRRGSFYETGQRSGAWVKFKVFDEDEFVVGGYRPYNRNFDCILVGQVREGRLQFVGRVMGGFTPQNRRPLWEQLKALPTSACPFSNLPWRTRGRWKEGITAKDMPSFHWIEPSTMIRIGHQGWTDGVLLRHPRFVSLA